MPEKNRVKNTYTYARKKQNRSERTGQNRPIKNECENVYINGIGVPRKKQL